MICPRCQGELFEAVKQGVVIDHCSGCKGIWLDQGELAKIIAHMKQVESGLPPWIIPELKLDLGQSQPRDPGGA